MTDLAPAPQVRRPLAGAQSAVDAALAEVVADLSRRWGVLTPDGSGGPADSVGGGDATAALTAADVLGYLVDFLARPGKRIRPQMCFWGWASVHGTDADPAANGYADMVTAGAALELLHVLGLVHDDVMDESDQRRGRPTVHRRAAADHRRHRADGDPDRYGESIAVLVGDLAHTEAVRLAMTLPPPMREVWNTLSLELMIGQATDLAGAAGRRRDLVHARAIARTKSGAYTVVRPLDLGATAAGADPLVRQGLARYGHHVGEAFALRDDLLGAFGNTSATGKPVGDDLVAGKPTVLLALAAQTDDPAVHGALARIENRSVTTDDVPEIQATLAAAGITDRAEALIADATAAALLALDTAPIHPDAREGLTDLARSIAWRTA